MTIKIKDKLFLINKKGNITGQVTVASNFKNKKEIAEYEEANNVNVYNFTNKKGKEKLYVGDKISYLTAVNNYKMR